MTKKETRSYGTGKLTGQEKEIEREPAPKEGVEKQKKRHQIEEVAWQFKQGYSGGKDRGAASTKEGEKGRPGACKNKRDL